MVAFKELWLTFHTHCFLLQYNGKGVMEMSYFIDNRTFVPATYICLRLPIRASKLPWLKNNFRRYGSILERLSGEKRIISPCKISDASDRLFFRLGQIDIFIYFWI